MKFLTYFLLAVVMAKGFCSPYPARHMPEPMKPDVNEIGGEKLKYQVGILLKSSNSRESWCSGSLIDHEWVLTAAHCMEEIEEAVVYLGSSQRQFAEVVYKIGKENFIIHHDWHSYNIENDICLIRIPYTHYSEKIEPVQLPAINATKSTYNGDEVIASGWGQVSGSSANLSKHFSGSILYVFKNERCREYFGSVIQDSNICASTYGLSSICKGDSGGPLVLQSSMTQIGVSSFSSQHSCDKGIPSVFTRVSSYLDWIKSNTAN